MAGSSRALVQFSYGMSRASRRVEVFCCGARLIRLTDALRVRDSDAAWRDGGTGGGWNSGPRIGE